MIWPALAVLSATVATACLVAVRRLLGEVRQLRERVTYLDAKLISWPDPPTVLRDVMNQDR